MIDPIRSWAGRYREALGEGPSDRSLGAQRARLLLAHSTGWPHRRGGAKWAIVGTCATAALCAAWVFLAASPSETPGPAPAPLVVGQLVATSGATKQVEFPGGTRATWDANSRGRLSRYSEDLVELTLRDGSLAMDVVKHEGRRWVIKAGDFEVQVIGTAFTVKRNAGSGAFAVEVTRGRVSVRGIHLKEQIILGAGQTFHWDPSAKRDEPSKPTAKEEQPEPPNLGEAEDPVAPKRNSTLGAKRSEDWQVLAKSGRYAEAIGLVEKRGGDRVLSGASPGDRILLGNAARFSGKLALAEKAYIAARSSKDSGTAALAAYYLARVSLDGRGSSGKAVGWFRTYLEEAPMGELSASARARLMDLLDQSGDHIGARKVATEYVSLHPDGPHIERAKRLSGPGP